MLAGALNPPLIAHAFVASQITALQLDFIRSFIISLLYLTKSKFHIFSFCVTVEVLFHKLDIILVSRNNVVNPTLGPISIYTTY